MTKLDVLEIFYWAIPMMFRTGSQLTVCLPLTTAISRKTTEE